MLQVTLAFIVAGVFLAAVAGKARHRSALGDVADVARQLNLPDTISRHAGKLLLAGEFCAAVLIVVPPFSPLGAALAVVLLAGMAWGIQRIRTAGTGATCRCFGGSATELRARHVVRNLALALAATAVLALRLAQGPPHLAFPQWALAFAAASVATLAVVHLDDLIFLFGPSKVPQRPVPKGSDS
ncbi:MauE/DoxX family redox-associated membrane protein [Actinoplanes sp. NPDC051861]|uniref:MauE/DoxX family redox-associated membrane protein n=1 Tax=Actinoplanes sp. NPDC051861 TaxID=3155170 RepID=UPI003422E78F